jgi:hypothetical protein
MVPGHAALAALALGHRYAVRFGESAQRVPGLAVEHAAAHHDQRPLCRAQKMCGTRQFGAIGRHAPEAEGFGVQEVLGAVEGLGLHVLRQRQAHGAAAGRIDHGLDRAGQGREDLLRPQDAVEIARDRAQAIVDAQVAVRKVFELLQHRVRCARGETSPGSSSTGRRLTWASAAAVTRLVAPGPMEVVTAMIRWRNCALA